jgi:hydroxyacylglutathione hydrolase
MILTLPLSVSNAYIIPGENPVLVDTGLEADFSLLVRLIRQQGLEISELGLIVITHAHADHAGGLAELRKHVDVPVIIQEQEKSFLESGTNAPAPEGNLWAPLLKKFIPAEFPGFTPEMIFSQSCSLLHFGISGTLLHTPGHTDGSCSVLMGEETKPTEVVAGDLLSGGMLGGMIQSGKASWPMVWTNKQQLKIEVEKMLSYSSLETFYVGHGGPLSRQSVERLLKDSAQSF